MRTRMLIVIPVAVSVAILLVAILGFHLDVEPEFADDDNIYFVTDPQTFFQIDYNHDRVINGDLKYLLEAQKILDASDTLPIVSTYADGTLESIQLGLSLEIKNTMSESEIVDKIRELVDVPVYVFFEEAIDH